MSLFNIVLTVVVLAIVAVFLRRLWLTDRSIQAERDSRRSSAPPDGAKRFYREPDHSTLVQLAIHGQENKWQTFNMFLLLQSFLILSWSSLFQRQSALLLVLIGIALIGILSAVVWSFLGLDYVRASNLYGDRVRDLEQQFPEEWRIFGARGDQREDKLPFADAKTVTVGVPIAIFVLWLAVLTWTLVGPATPITESGIPAHPTDALFAPLILLLAFIAGCALMFMPKGRLLRRFAGFGLAATATFFAGAKFLSIDKAVSLGNLFSINYDNQNLGDQPAHDVDEPFYFTARFSQFDPGRVSAASELKFECRLATFAAALSQDDDLSLITIVGRADRRELLPHVRKLYASNWGLAQQRADFAADLFERNKVPSFKLITSVAGPLHTDNSQPRTMMDADRALTVIVRGTGSQHAWAASRTSGVEWMACNPDLMPTDRSRTPSVLPIAR